MPGITLDLVDGELGCGLHQGRQWHVRSPVSRSGWRSLITDAASGFSQPAKTREGAGAFLDRFWTWVRGAALPGCATGIAPPGLPAPAEQGRGETVTGQRYNMPMADSISSPPADAGPLPLVPRTNSPAGGTRVKRRVSRRRPLPDAAAIRVVPVPDTAPPYDDLLRGSGRLRAVADPDQPRGSRARRGTLSRLVAVGGEPGTGQAFWAGIGPAAQGSSPRGAGQPAQPGQGPVIGAWPSQFAQVLAETLAGTRPPEQLVPWTTEQARERISQLGPLMAAAHRPRIRRVIVTCPTRDVLEMTVVVGLGSQVRALALRLEKATAPVSPDSAARRRENKRSGPETTQWLCTAIEAA
jgi:hypothetical protein